MRNSIEKIFGSEVNKILHVVGHGPSLREYVGFLKSINPQKEKIVSLNDIDVVADIIPDYWVTTNPVCSVQDYHNRINEYPNCTFIYSDVMDLTDMDLVKSLLKVKFYTFDHIHFKSEPNIFWVKGWRLGCNRGWIDCCSRIVPGRLTIQEHLQKISGYEHHFSTTDTTILSTLAISVLLKPSEIYLYGVDLDYTIGYANPEMFNSDSFDYWMDRILSDFYIIYESAKLLGIKINYLGWNENLKRVFDGERPNKVYPSDCKNYD